MASSSMACGTATARWVSRRGNHSVTSPNGRQAYTDTPPHAMAANSPHSARLCTDVTLQCEAPVGG